MNRPFDIKHVYEQNHDATVWVGNLAPQVDDEILWELFLQAGPVKKIHIPTDNVTQTHQGFGFVEMESIADCNYALQVLSGIKLYGHSIRCSKATQDKKAINIGAKLFVGSLSSSTDEQLLMKTFGTFGQIISVHLIRDPETKESKGHAFVSFDSFDASDAALAALNGQFLGGNRILVDYAYKNDTKGERHGSAAERLLATSRASHNLVSNS